MIYSFKRGEPKKGWVTIVHGLGEHIGRYERLIDMFIQDGYGVVGFDLPGHGKSSGKRGHTCIEDILEIIDELTKEAKSFLLFGHSLGGLIAVRYTETRPQKVDKLIISSPALSIQPSKSQKIMLNVFSVIMPSLTVSNGIDPKLLSRNAEAVQRYISDSLVHDRISIKLGKSMLKNVELAHEQVERIICPTAVLIGTEDKVTPPEGAKRFYEKLKVRKVLKEFDGGYHELFEDPVFADSFHETIVKLASEDF